MLDAATLKTMKISRFERVGFVLFCFFNRTKCAATLVSLWVIEFFCF